MLKDVLDEIALHPHALAVHVEEITADLLEVRIDCDPGDVKRLIGSKGLHISALRRWVKLWGDANCFGVTIRDFEAPKDTSDRYDKFQHNPAWPKDRLLSILKRLAESVAEGPINVECVDREENSHVALRFRDGEDGKVMAALGEVLAILGNAMGKKNGHTLAVHLRPERLATRATRR